MFFFFHIHKLYEKVRCVRQILNTKESCCLKLKRIMNKIVGCKGDNKNRDSGSLKRVVPKGCFSFFLAMTLRYFHHSGIGPPRPCHIPLYNYT